MFGTPCDEVIGGGWSPAVGDHRKRSGAQHALDLGLVQYEPSGREGGRVMGSPSGRMARGLEA